jgi:ribonuclease BN (tRNA processing enzyme)
VKITLIPSGHAADGVAPHQYLTSYLINDRVAVDAGCIGFWHGPNEQVVIRHIFLSHTHIDHLASLPIFLENVAGMKQGPVTIYASEVVQQSLRQDLFNGRVWPRFLEMTMDGAPFVILQTLLSGEAVTVEGLRVTPVAVDHAVPTLGFLIEDPSASVVITSDTGPTSEIWVRTNKTPNVKAVFLEASFPNELAALATKTKHLTPAGFAAEMAKVVLPARFIAVHLKAQFRDQVTQELLASGSSVEIARFGVPYEF